MGSGVARMYLEKPILIGLVSSLSQLVGQNLCCAEELLA